MLSVSSSSPIAIGRSIALGLVQPEQTYGDVDRGPCVAARLGVILQQNHQIPVSLRLTGTGGFSLRFPKQNHQIPVTLRDTGTGGFSLRLRKQIQQIPVTLRHTGM